MGHEAVINAARHGGAKAVGVRVQAGPDRAKRLDPILAASHDRDVLLRAEQLLQAIEHDRVIVGEDELKRHGVLPSARGEGRSPGAPPACSNRS